MLRILLISLLLTNLALAAYQFSQTAEAKVAGKTLPAAALVSPDSKVPTIHLFSELIEDQDLSTDNRQCFTLGPFHSDDELPDFYARLADMTVSLKERESQALVEKGYWVYLPAYPSLLEANRALLSLQALGFEDMAVMFEGEHKNALSLGYFLRQGNALRRKAAIESKGFAAQMRIQREAEPRFWLDYEQLPGSGFLALDMQGRPNDFMQRATPCAEQPVLDANLIESGTVESNENTEPTEPLPQSEEPEQEIEQF